MPSRTGSLRWVRVALYPALGCCAPEPGWQADAMVLFGAERGALVDDTYVRPPGAEVVSGSVLEDLRLCGVTRFEVFDPSAAMSDVDAFHVVAPRREVLAARACLRRKLPAGVATKPYRRAEWPEGRSDLRLEREAGRAEQVPFGAAVR